MKKTVLLFSIIGLAVGILIYSPQAYNFCVDGGHCWGLWKALDNINSYFFIFIPLLFISLVTYPLRGEIFHFWTRFVLLAVPAYFLIVSILVVLEKSNRDISFIEPISMLLSGLFFVTSIILIISKYITLQK
ncbi:MAG: hypothetical protein M0P64_01805 [Candidatus Pacebacteria bacterium]|nr:hypothetical protein [Candidatus Paceibacterota bacterium]